MTSSLWRTLPRLLWAALLVLLFVAAARARFHLPLTPLADPDVWCYLNPPLAKLLGGPFQHTYGQCFLYPGLLYVVLAVGGDCRGITLVQHGFGLGTGALLLVAWRQARAFLPAPRLPGWLFDIAGLGVAAVYLLSTTSIRFEHSLRPEAVFPFFAVLNIVCNLAFIRRRFFLTGAGSDPRTVAAGAAAVVTCVLTFLLKPSFSVMLLLANLPVLVSLFRPGSSRRAKLALALIPALVAGLGLLLPEALLRRADPDAHSFLAESLLTVHADLIRDQMAADLAHGHTAPYDPRWLAGVEARLASEIRLSAGAGHYPSLGFNPDYLKQQNSFIGWLTNQMGGTEPMADFCDDYYRRAWRGRPLAMGRKIWRQLGVFYRFGSCPAYRMYHNFQLRGEYAASAVGFDTGRVPPDPRPPKFNSNFARMQRYPPTREFLARCARLGQVPGNIVGSPVWVETAGGWLSATYLVGCLGAFGFGAAAWGVAAVRRWSGPAAGVLLLLYAYNFGTTLSIAIGHSMDIGRYSMYQFAYTLLPQCVGGWLALEGGLTLGAFLLALGAPAFAARARPLPAPEPPVGGEPLVGFLPPGGSGGDQAAGWAAGCRELFPGGRWYFPADSAGNGAGSANPDVWLVVDDAQTPAYPVETARDLVRSYVESPADLITTGPPSLPSETAAFDALARWAVGQRIDLLAGMRLLSDRFYRAVPPAVWRPGTPATASALATSISAAGRGFLVRALPLRTDHHDAPEVAPASHLKTVERFRLGWRLSVLCCRYRPWRCLGTVAALGLLLALVLGLSAVHHPAHARHRYTVRRGMVTVAGGFAAAALASAAAASVLAARQRRWRRTFLLDGSPS